MQPWFYEKMKIIRGADQDTFSQVTYVTMFNVLVILQVLHLGSSGSVYLLEEYSWFPPGRGGESQTLSKTKDIKPAHSKVSDEY